MRKVDFVAETGSPDTQAWHDWRKGGIGGSDAPHIAAGYGVIERFKGARSLESIAKEKSEDYAPRATGGLALFGKMAEGVILERVMDHLGIEFKPVFGESEEDPKLRASFDGMSPDGRVIIEIKTTTQDISNNSIQRYLPQVIHQSLVAWGSEENKWGEAFLAVLYHDPAKPVEESNLIIYDPEELNKIKIFSSEALLEAENRFWREWIEGNIQYDPMEELGRRYVEIEQKMAALKAEKDKLREEMIGMLDNRDRLENRFVTISRTIRQGGLDVDALLDFLNVDPEATSMFRKPDTEQIVIRCKKQS